MFLLEKGTSIKTTLGFKLLIDLTIFRNNLELKKIDLITIKEK